MTFIIWLVLALPIGFLVGAVGMALWLALKPLMAVGVRAAWQWIRATVTGGF